MHPIGARMLTSGVIALSLILILNCGGPMDHWPRERFSGTVWRELPENERYRLARDLLESRTLIGLRREEVAELLGSPSFSAIEGEYDTYVLKHTDSKDLTLDFVYLLRVEYRDGVVARVAVRSD